MQRELKFRVWHKRYERFLFGDFTQAGEDDYDLETIFKADSGLMSNKKLGEKYGFLYFYPNEDVIIQQFTGLQDKNKKEIYEGDIVQLPFSDLGIIEFGIYKDNEQYRDYEHYGWFINAKESYDKRFPEATLHTYTVTLIDCYKNIQIISNIFENPELIK